MTKTPMPIRAGERVNVAGHQGPWKVLNITAGLAHLTKLTAFERIDLREIPIDRLTRRQGSFL